MRVVGIGDLKTRMSRGAVVGGCLVGKTSWYDERTKKGKGGGKEEGERQNNFYLNNNMK